MATAAQAFLARLESGNFEFEPNGFYMLLSELKDPGKYHWGLYLAYNQRDGRVFHLEKSEETNMEWKFQSDPTTEAWVSKALRLAYKLGEIEPDWHEALALRISMVSRDEPVTCLTWLKRALRELHEEDYITLTRSITQLEFDALSRAYTLPRQPGGNDRRVF
ncbi:hypothetical protein N7456_010249 [Penicillium angulare]|uniref:Uncharacterized protein n=1 Tax=Penicillium angulare TaxID=116970 RepID=A0A9W9F687_9EURO|nr:hypothetical protein N7456_010249 [Penicillium angulare]